MEGCDSLTGRFNVRTFLAVDTVVDDGGSGRKAVIEPDQ